ncbi:MAG: nucleotidyltransferase domain-containing protein [Calditrichaeota bacterium]|nr:MAG: nucleotidyltransferase domain-containing protein [Calditrichota bacterium]MBL1203856.1 nucleotidyltransferase domain-containing protein [Calditrichota bacterium]NOG43688.1 nucleotidyltransferase domain-containing protein [Calditrichota bacterium]
MKTFGIAKYAFDKLILLISQNPRFEKVVIFGSRAMDTYQEGSDIDLALYGPEVKLNDQLDLIWKLEKLGYPYSYDFLIHKNIKDQNVLDHIERVGIIIYKKNH